MRKRACSLEAIESMIADTQRKSARKMVFLQVTVSISPGNTALTSTSEATYLGIYSSGIVSAADKVKLASKVLSYYLDTAEVI